MSVAIKFTKVSKKYTTKYASVNFIQKLRGRDSQQRTSINQNIWILKDVTFLINKGESVALVGVNGAGKSTILKLISSIIVPSKGNIEVNGRISSLLELGAGFHPDLTGRENIYLNGAILGWSRLQVKQEIEKIIAFSELEEFIDMPVKHYSSGMYMRLGFAIATSIDPDILLVDEVLAVGDLRYQSKCITRINKMRANGTTIIFVSHEPEIVKKICDRAVWLEDGRVHMIDSSERVIEAYKKSIANSILQTTPGFKADIATNTEKRWGSKLVEITKVRFLDEYDNECQMFETNQPFTIEISYLAHHDIELPAFGIAIYREDGTHISGSNTSIDQFTIEKVTGEGKIYYRLKQLPLLTGSYEGTVAIYDTQSIYPYDHHERCYKFSVSQGKKLRRSEGLVYLPGKWNH